MVEQQGEQGYVDLIERLLTCPADQEEAILQTDAKWVDVNLVAMMRQMATEMSQQGKENAVWLMQFAGQVAQRLGLETAEDNPPENLGQFLFETLQLVANSGGDARQVYPLLVLHQDYLNEQLLQWLPILAARWLGGEPEQLQSVAAALGGFGNLLQKFPLGVRWLNLELSIAAYRLTLQAYSQETFSEDWATTQNNLAAAYTLRVRGDRAENIEQAIAAYHLSLQVLTCEAFPVAWAMTQNNLASAYRIRIKDNRAENIEQAIAAYQLSLEVLTCEAFPVAWAMTLNNIAIAYRNRIQGNRAENIEQAIAAYQEALKVRTREAFPEQWAMTQNNLAAAYSERIQGNRAENIEEAIVAYQEVLQVYTREAFPADWATTQHNLASAYSDRIQENRVESLELAIVAYQEALKVRTREAFPEQWAMTQNNLANVYRERIQGDRAENIEQAIAACLLALQVRTRNTLPEQWATTQHNLANAYIDRVRGNRAENIEQAIAAYELALQVRTCQAFPTDWAMTKNNLATAYNNRIQGDWAANIERAIEAYQQSLEVFTREAFPEKWAMTQSNLANAYRSGTQGEREENLELAIAAYELSLQVFTREAFPEQWANTQSNLANAYGHSLRGDQAENIEQAIKAYEHSLQVLTPKTFPNDCRRTARSLGNLHFEQKNWSKAAEAYSLALQAAESLYQSTILLDSRAAELTITGDLPSQAAYTLAQMGQLEGAVIMLEQGLARGLSETLERDQSNLSQLQLTHPDLLTQYQNITNRLRNLESQQRLRMTSEEHHSLTPKALRIEALGLSQMLTETIEQVRQVEGYTDFLTQPDLSDIQQAVRPDVPLVYLILTSLGSLAVIVAQDGIANLWLDDLNETSFEELLNTWFNAYEQSRTNQNTWLEAIDQVTCQLWKPLMAPLIDILKQHSFQQATLIPTGYLSFLPLHAAWTKDSSTVTGKRYALDEILFTYAPNARSLNAAAIIAQRTGTNSILAINNPLQDLPNSTREVTASITTFPQYKVLKHEEATIETVLAALPHYNILHLSCHGTANLREPLKSGLAMSDGILTLRDILDLRLGEQEQGGIRLAILSACETGLVGTELADEAMGLPTGLLQAGVAGIVASLWQVDDLGTMMLLVRFYGYWRNENLEPASALRQAQQWVRDTTSQQKAQYFKESNPDLFQSLILLPPNYFAHSFYWAAFSYVGV